ncbi:hypothetical protein, partial [Phytoactinopolyspora endophytica]|uniref:hypothetical protein n=1 Tax=Phytoactinopolyspora endophytica TaxID=1642495 RepID=UPI00197B2F23
VATGVRIELWLHAGLFVLVVLFIDISVLSVTLGSLRWWGLAVFSCLLISQLLLTCWLMLNVFGGYGMRAHTARRAKMKLDANIASLNSEIAKDEMGDPRALVCRLVATRP